MLEQRHRTPSLQVSEIVPTQSCLLCKLGLGQMPLRANLCNRSTEVGAGPDIPSRHPRPSSWM